MNYERLKFLIFVFRFWNLAKTLRIPPHRSIGNRRFGSTIEARLSNNNNNNNSNSYSNNNRRFQTKFKLNKTTFPSQTTTTTTATAATMWFPAVTFVDSMSTFLSPTNSQRRQTLKRIRNFLMSMSSSRTPSRRRSDRRKSTLFNPSTCWTSNSSSRSSKTWNASIECRQRRRRQLQHRLYIRRLQQTSEEHITDFQTIRRQTLRLFHWELFETFQFLWKKFKIWSRIFIRDNFSFVTNLQTL